MGKTVEDLIGRKAYKDSRGLYGGLVGVVERSDSGITPLWICLPDGLRLGAFPKDVIVVED